MYLVICPHLFGSSSKLTSITSLQSPILFISMNITYRNTCHILVVCYLFGFGVFFLGLWHLVNFLIGFCGLIKSVFFFSQLRIRYTLHCECFSISIFLFVCDLLNSSTLKISAIAGKFFLRLFIRTP